MGQSKTVTRGRPKSAEPGGTVCTWLRASEHDKLIKLAQKRDTSVSTLVRQIIVPNLR